MKLIGLFCGSYDQFPLALVDCSKLVMTWLDERALKLLKQGVGGFKIIRGSFGITPLNKIL